MAVPDADLTRRELEVLALVARGKTNRVIGRELDISPRTVQKHLERVFRKLRVRTRTAAVARAAELMADTESDPRLGAAWVALSAKQGEVAAQSSRPV